MSFAGSCFRRALEKVSTRSTRLFATHVRPQSMVRVQHVSSKVGRSLQARCSSSVSETPEQYTRYWVAGLTHENGFLSWTRNGVIGTVAAVAVFNVDPFASTGLVVMSGSFFGIGVFQYWRQYLRARHELPSTTSTFVILAPLIIISTWAVSMYALLQETPTPLIEAMSNGPKRMKEKHAAVVLMEHSSKSGKNDSTDATTVKVVTPAPIPLSNQVVDTHVVTAAIAHQVAAKTTQLEEKQKARSWSQSMFAWLGGTPSNERQCLAERDALIRILQEQQQSST
eukprot:m.8362 g.8362  ORF g.8362 m.8362 type:complete len:283 (-) comp5350_c0_seq1:3072-3920(-)